jgi:uncharacterized protein YeaO (DUF488 family)
VPTPGRSRQAAQFCVDAPPDPRSSGTPASLDSSVRASLFPGKIADVSGRPRIVVKRVYEPPRAADGRRVLVDRVWPRGLRREEARIDRWAKDLAPSTELRRWFGHRPERFPEFRDRYRAELRGRESELDELLDGGTLTLLFAARDEEHNNARVLAELLEERAAASAPSGRRRAPR